MSLDLLGAFGHLVLIAALHPEWRTPAGAKNRCAAATLEVCVALPDRAGVAWVSWAQTGSNDTEHMAAVIYDDTVVDFTVRQFPGCEHLPFPYVATVEEWSERMGRLGICLPAQVLTPDEAFDMAQELAS